MQQGLSTYTLVWGVGVEFAMNISLHQTGLASILFSQEHNFQIYLPRHLDPTALHTFLLLTTFFFDECNLAKTADWHVIS